MGVFDDVVNTVKNVADVTAKKTNDIVELTKAKKKKYDIEQDIKKLYCDIGMVCYDANKAGSEVGDGVQDKYSEIDALYEKLSDVKAYIGSLKGTKECPSCGSENQTDSKYCSSCGNEI